MSLSLALQRPVAWPAAPVVGTARVNPADRSRLEPDSEELLLARVANGDCAAMAELYDATSRHVFGLALRILAERGAAEDVLAEVYAQAWRQASRFDRGRGNALTWLLRIAHSRAIDALRARRREPAAAPLEAAEAVPDTAETPEGATAAAERHRLVHAALEKLSREQREAIDLAYFGGLSHGEIAARLGEPLGTVKTRIRLAMQKLRERLAADLASPREAEKGA